MIKTPGRCFGSVIIPVREKCYLVPIVMNAKAAVITEACQNLGDDASLKIHCPDAVGCRLVFGGCTKDQSIARLAKFETDDIRKPLLHACFQIVENQNRTRFFLFFPFFAGGLACRTRLAIRRFFLAWLV